MLQSFIEDINCEYPKLGKVAIYKMFCSLKGKHKFLDSNILLQHSQVFRAFFI
ncbi:unnamed protein product [marine sediment metagenome]|uniref:Uncharacterized protein n=1 Tax=marine sediment metagenome TaxID=412755 RepID=X0YDB1_9ZZZZ